MTPEIIITSHGKDECGYFVRFSVRGNVYLYYLDYRAQQGVLYQARFSTGKALNLAKKLGRVFKES